jgi:hypothetical protein
MSFSQEKRSGDSSDEARLSPSPGPDLSGNEALREPQVEKPAPDPSPRNIHGVKVSRNHRPITDLLRVC